MDDCIEVDQSSEDLASRSTDSGVLETTSCNVQEQTGQSVLGADCGPDSEVVLYQQVVAEVCVRDSNLADDHCYSKAPCNIPGYSQTHNENERKNQSNDVTDLTAASDDEMVQEFSAGFVSSMIEVIDEAEEDEDVQRGDAESSSESETASSDSDSSDSTSESSSTDSCSHKIRHEDVELAEEIKALSNLQPPRTHGEILRSELPPVEDLHISLPDESVLQAIGKVSQMVSDNTVVVKSYPNKPALDVNTVLFFTKQLALGVVDETFGPVPCPFYVVRFNGKDHLEEKGVELDREVYFVPRINDFTTFVFVAKLKKMRGSDASWIHDIEPPPAFIDYSDDEQEREARRQRKNKQDKNTNDQEGRRQGKDKQDNTNTSRRAVPAPVRRRGKNRDRWPNCDAGCRLGSAESSSWECQAGWQAAVNNLSRNQDLPGQGNSHVSGLPGIVPFMGMPPPPPPYPQTASFNPQVQQSHHFSYSTQGGNNPGHCLATSTRTAFPHQNMPRFTFDPPPPPPPLSPQGPPPW